MAVEKRSLSWVSPDFDPVAAGWPLAKKVEWKTIDWRTYPRPDVARWLRW